MKVQRADYAGGLFGTAHADDGSRDRRVEQGPRDGYLPRSAAMAGADFLHPVGQGEVAGELGFLEGRGAAPEIVLWHGCDAFTRHLASEQA